MIIDITWRDEHNITHIEQGTECTRLVYGRAREIPRSAKDLFLEIHTQTAEARCISITDVVFLVVHDN